MDKDYLSWWQVEKASNQLALLCKDYNPDVIVGIARGGLIPAVMVSHTYKKRLIYVDAKFYKDIEDRDKEPIIRSSLSGEVESKKVLIIDDVVDTGKTLKTIMNHVKERDPDSIMTAALVTKPHAEMKPDQYIFKTDRWVVFPWENFPVEKQMEEEE